MFQPGKLKVERADCIVWICIAFRSVAGAAFTVMYVLRSRKLPKNSLEE